MRCAGLSLGIIFALAAIGCSHATSSQYLSDSGSGREIRYNAPLPAGPSAAAEDQPAVRLSNQPSDLKVMTFNLRVPFLLDGVNFWSLRRELVVQTVRGFEPDLLGTQECPKTSAEFLRLRLMDYEFVGVGRNDGKERGEMCAMFFKRDRFERLEEGHFWLSQTPMKAGSKGWGASNPRLVSWVTLKPVDGSPSFCWFNTHFDNASSRARVESAKLLRSAVASIANNMPVVITGDFNADQHTAPYDLLVGGRHLGAESELYDAFRVAHPVSARDEGTMHNFHGGKNGDRIDWILTNNLFQPIEVAIDHTQRGPQFPSDHFPVKATLRPVTGGLGVARID